MSFWHATLIQLRRSQRARCFIAFLLGLLTVFAMPPFGAWPILFAVFPALIKLVDWSMAADGASACFSLSPFEGGQGERGLRSILPAAAIGWSFGFGYFLFGLYWIGEAFLVEADKFAWLLPFAVTLLPAFLALFFSAGFAAARAGWHPGGARVVALALGLGASEWLRGVILTGFPWMTLGHALTSELVLMQAVSIGGVNPLTFFAVLLFGSPVLLLERPRLTRLPMACLALLLLDAGYGAWRLQTPLSPPVPNVRLRIVQPNIPQADKFEGAARQRIFQTFIDLSQRNAQGEMDGAQPVTHVFWPESSLPFLLLDSRDGLDAIADLLPDDKILVAGALRLERLPAAPGASGETADFRVYNSIAVLDGQAKLLSLYDKRHLVPFGEYLPFQFLLESIGLEQLTGQRGGLTGGVNPQTLAVPGLPLIGPLICYEAIFSGTLPSGAARPGLMFNATNDAWFGTSFGPRQHFHQSRLRAVELGLPLVRAANTGISAIVDPYGRVLQSLDLDHRGVIDSDLPQALPATLYATLGTWIFLATMASGLGLYFALAHRQRSSTS